jgi:cupin fold WbuC family metalloprotein
MKRIDAELFERLRVLAQASPRRRSHVNWHDPARDVVQRFFIHMLPGTYVRPHRHLTQRRFELTVVLDGGADLLLFDDAGTVREIVQLRPGSAVRGVELPCSTWHSYRVTHGGLTLLEIKQGPYQETGAKDFAHWAPAESAAEVPSFVAWLHRATVGERWPGGTEKRSQER